ncbi:hypothetical protein FACS1894142_3460 [Spirochaetia bacterium]|nr:hypothetical protein FACS1894142_3460 [Spirochaetia bacterium]
MSYIISIILSTIILFLRIKTNMFERITKFVHNTLANKNIMRVITMTVLIIISMVCYIALFYSSAIVKNASSDITEIVNTVEEDHYWLGIIDFLKDCIIFSPAFWFVLFFLYQNLVYYRENATKSSEENDIDTEI